MHSFLKFILEGNSTCFGQFLCPSSGVFLLYSQQWYMSYSIADNLQAGSGWNILILRASCQKTCMTYTIVVCTVKNS